MKKLFAYVLILSVLILLSGHATAKPVIGKYAYLDLQKALNNCNAGEESKKYLEDIIQAAQAEINNKRGAGESQEKLESLINNLNSIITKKQKAIETLILVEIENTVKSFAETYGYILIIPADIIDFKQSKIKAEAVSGDVIKSDAILWVINGSLDMSELIDNTSGFIDITDAIIEVINDNKKLMAELNKHFSENLLSEKIKVTKKTVVSQAPSDVDELPTIKTATNKNAYAIVIGIEEYRQKLPKADFAAHDAETVTEYLTKTMGYPEENVVTLLNDHATMSDFIKYFEKWLPNRIEKGATVFVYYSGHGAPNPKTGEAYLVPYDGDPTFIDETGYPLKRLYESLGKLEAKEIIVALDSCFSGGGGRSVLAKGARPLVITMDNSMVLSQKIAVLSASGGAEISSTYDEKGHGLFTYFMLKGLKGEADANKDGSIAIGELFGYLKPEIERTARRLYNNEQSPLIIIPDEKRGLVLIGGQ